MVCGNGADGDDVKQVLMKIELSFCWSFQFIPSGKASKIYMFAPYLLH